MSDNDDLIAYPNIPTRPKWEEETILEAGNQLEIVVIQFDNGISVKDPFFADKCFLMIESDPHIYEYACEYPIWKTTMKE